MTKDIALAGIERVGAVIKSGFHEIPIRMYKMDGKVGCSVSTACDVIVPLHLREWFKKTDGKKAEEHRDATATIGSSGHALIEKQAGGEEVVPSEHLTEWFAEWNKTQAQFKISAEASEIKVFSRVFAFGGQIDRIGMFDGKRCVIDFKTGRYSHINLWKTEAYRQAYIEMTGDREIGAVILHLPRPDLMKKGQTIRHYTIQHHETCFLNFLCAYQAFRMLYYKELIAAGMTEKDVFAPMPFWFYEREYGAGVNKPMEAK